MVKIVCLRFVLNLKSRGREHKGTCHYFSTIPAAFKRSKMIHRHVSCFKTMCKYMTDHLHDRKSETYQLQEKVAIVPKMWLPQMQSVLESWTC